MPALATQTRTVEQAGALSKSSKANLKVISVVVEEQTKADVRNYADKKEMTVSEIMRRAWEFARSHPEFLTKTNKKEQDLQKKFGPNRYHSPSAE